MSFDPKYDVRYTNVISPAIASVDMDGIQLLPLRVDNSKTGDSILTDILDGIAHSQMVLADLSVIGRDAVTGLSYRNGNVMYEVGLALACRQPQDVLLIRDDNDQFLFDVSTIPHLRLDFTDTSAARERLAEELRERIRHQQFLNDARVQNAFRQLSGDEIRFLREIHQYNLGPYFGKESGSLANWFSTATGRLLDKHVITVAGEFTDGKTAYELTPLGLQVQVLILQGLPQLIGRTVKAIDTLGSSEPKTD